MPIRILVVDDHPMLRAALRLLIDSQPDMNVIGEMHCIQDAIKSATDLAPDMIILDLCTPRGNGISGIRQWKVACPRTRVLVLNMHDDPAYIRSALAAGAVGYVSKSHVDLELLAAIRVVNSGGEFVTPLAAFAPSGSRQSDDTSMSRDTASLVYRHEPVVTSEKAAGARGGPLSMNGARS